MINCSSCGTSMQPGNNFCQLCGGQAMQQQPQQMNQQQKFVGQPQNNGQWGQNPQQQNWGQQNPNQMQGARQSNFSVAMGLGSAGIMVALANFQWPFLHWIGLALGISAIICGLVGLRNAPKRNAVIGISLGAAAVLVFVIMCFVNHFVLNVWWWW